jgi:hypothetical protein
MGFVPSAVVFSYHLSLYKLSISIAPFVGVIDLSSQHQVTTSVLVWSMSANPILVALDCCLCLPPPQSAGSMSVINSLSLQELFTENRLLKTLQKRQDLALSKYEGTKAALPQLIRSHNEEVRFLRGNLKHVSDADAYLPTEECINIYTCSEM